MTRPAGASGHLRKDRLHEQLAPALPAVAAGGSWWAGRGGGSQLKAASGRLGAP